MSPPMDEGAAFTCEWCDQSFVRRSAMGPSPKYCCAAHRQRAHEVRQLENIKAERDRLRAVVEAVQLVVTVARHIADEYNHDAPHAPTVAVPVGLMQALRGNLDQLDGSPEAADG